MNVLVTDMTNEYEGWLVCRSVSDVLSITGTLENLVFHKSKERSDDKVKYLKALYDKYTSCKFLYVCNRESTDDVVKMYIVGGLKGRYVDDDFFLSDAHELNGLIVDLPALTGTDMSSSSVLDDFFNRYMSNGESGISKGYLQVVKKAASEMVEAYQEKSLEIIKLSESASEIFSNSVDLVANMKERQRRMEKDLQLLRERKEEVDSLTSKVPAGSPILFYPRVTYMKSKTILRFKEIGNTPYIVSFMLGFRLYLERVKIVRPKLIVIENQGEMIEKKYDEYAWVTQKTKSDGSLFFEDVVFTNCPTSNIIAKMLDDTNYDTFVVLDRTKNYKDHLLNAKGPEFVVSASNAMVERFKISKAMCISVGKALRGTSMEIPYFSDYPERDDQRVNTYLRECAALYESLFMSK